MNFNQFKVCKKFITDYLVIYDALLLVVVTCQTDSNRFEIP